MNIRLTNMAITKLLNKNDEIKSSAKILPQNHFACLNGNDVITTKISDHHPIVYNNVLFWNVMMQGRSRLSRARKNDMSFNNGFGIIETHDQYIERLITIGIVIAEIINRNRSIEAIGLCEGPIEEGYVNALLWTLMRFCCMKRFIMSSHSPDLQNIFYKPNRVGADNWGLLMLADKKYKVTEVSFKHMSQIDIGKKLANRFQIWELKENDSKKYLSLGHFPFEGDEYVTNKSQLSMSGKSYCNLVNNLMDQYSNDQLILCADFNLNPYLINQWQDRVFDKIPNNNSILFTSDEKRRECLIRSATVDGILLSLREKQKYYSFQQIPDLSAKLILEYSFFNASVRKGAIICVSDKKRQLSKKLVSGGDARRRF